MEFPFKCLMTELIFRLITTDHHTEKDSVVKRNLNTKILPSECAVHKFQYLKPAGKPPECGVVLCVYSCFRLAIL